MRKGAEFTLVPVAEFVLGKRRILEIYLNVVEWGPGIYGAEAACRFHYGISVWNIGRDQAARLAAILPAPLKRRPGAHESLLRNHPEANEPSRLIIVSSILSMLRR